MVYIEVNIALFTKKSDVLFVKRTTQEPQGREDQQRVVEKENAAESIDSLPTEWCTGAFRTTFRVNGTNGHSGRAGQS